MLSAFVWATKNVLDLGTLQLQDEEIAGVCAVPLEVLKKSPPIDPYIGDHVSVPLVFDDGKTAKLWGITYDIVCNRTLKLFQLDDVSR